MSPIPPQIPGRPASDPAARHDGDQRIAKLLARAGVASRREIERMIAEGRVALGGSVVTTPATILRSLDGVTVDGEPVEAPAPARLFLYHKPAGLLVTERDPAGRPTIYDRLPADLPRVVPVGRLDLGTEGLLLLTTDGGLKRQLELPATGVQRAYRARAYGDVTQQALEALIEGVEIEGVRYGSIDANLERRTGANVWIEMILTEGKNREVRRVLEYLGLQVSRLIRTRYGPFVLGDLGPGLVGEVRDHDIASFRKNPTRLDLPQPARQRGPAPDGRPVGPAPVATAPRPPRPPRVEPERRGPTRPAPVRAERPERPVAAPTAPPRAAGRGAARAEYARSGTEHDRAGAGRADTGRSVDRSRRDDPPRAVRPSAPDAAGQRSGPGTPGTRVAKPEGAGRRTGGAGPAGGRGAPRREDAGKRASRQSGASGDVGKPARAARARAFRDRDGDDAAPSPRPSRNVAPARPGAGARPGQGAGPRPGPSRPVAGKPPRGGGARPPRSRS